MNLVDEGQMEEGNHCIVEETVNLLQELVLKSWLEISHKELAQNFIF